VSEGQVIAIVDDELKLAAESPESAALQSLSSFSGDGSSLMTLYRGEKTPEADASALADAVRARFPSHEVELHYGGQPHYDYIISVE
jgi:dihydroxyacetone kinase-like predicted kinase